MNEIEIRHCTVADIEAAPNRDALIDEYATSSAIDGLGKPDVQFPLYRAIEANGALHVIGAFAGEELVGFMGLIVSVLPHYGAVVGTSESFFIAPNARKGGTWKRMVEEAKILAAAIGAKGLFISAPHGSAFSQALPMIGGRQTNDVHFFAL